MDVCKLVDFLLVTEFPDGMEHPGVEWDKPTPNWDMMGYPGRAGGAIAGIADIARHRRDRNAHSTKTADAGCQDTVFDNVGGGSVWI
jgi:hypothetical protein